MKDGNFSLRREPADPADLVDPVPELPLPGERWTIRRKAAVVAALRGGKRQPRRS